MFLLCSRFFDGIVYLIPQAPNIDRAGPSADSSGGAGVPEIDITSAMIEAGCEALADFNYDFESREDAVVRIFEAMLSQTNLTRRS
jgi:hypothetical protein